jgi:prevent-host-death family protein
MNRIGIRELRADLSNQVKRAAAGEPVIVTVDGEPKAVLTPFAAEAGELTLEELIRTGRVIPGPRVNDPRPPRLEGVKGGRPTGEVLDEIREEKI